MYLIQYLSLVAYSFFGSAFLSATFHLTHLFSECREQFCLKVNESTGQKAHTIVPIFIISESENEICKSRPMLGFYNRKSLYFHSPNFQYKNVDIKNCPFTVSILPTGTDLVVEKLISVQSKLRDVLGSKDFNNFIVKDNHGNRYEIGYLEFLGITDPQFKTTSEKEIATLNKMEQISDTNK